MAAPHDKSQDSRARLTALVERAQAGDESTFGEIIELVQKSLYRFCIGICEEPNQAEDLCQEALVKGLQQIKKLKSPKTFQSWIFSIARNHFLDQVRRPGHTRELLDRKVASNDEPSAAELTASTGPGQDTLAEVHEALARLEPEDRELLILIDVEEFSYQEVAEIIKISESAVRSRLHRARKALISVLNGDE